MMEQGQIIKKLERFYDLDSKRYRDAQWFSSEAAQSNYNSTKEVILSSLELSVENSLLEIGCGPGTWTRELSPRVKNMVAIDISFEMIKQAKEYVGDYKIEYIHGDFLSYDFKGRCFDRISSVRVLEYFTDPERVLSKCFRLLNRNGRIVLVTKSTSRLWKHRNFILENLKKLGLCKREAGKNVPAEKGYDILFWQKLISPGRLKSIAEKIGFKDCRVIPIQIRLPIVAGGYNEIPILYGKCGRKYLAFSEEITKRINYYWTIISYWCIELSESYALIAKK